jgi:hypothetical protein
MGQSKPLPIISISCQPGQARILPAAGLSKTRSPAIACRRQFPSQPHVAAEIFFKGYFIDSPRDREILNGIAHRFEEGDLAFRLTA